MHARRGKRQKKPKDLRPERDKRRRAFLEAAATRPELPFVAVEGEAGSGKTVLLQHMAYVLATHHLRLGALPPHEMDLTVLQGARPLAPVPLLVDAARLSDALDAAHGRLDAALAAVVQAEMGEAPGPEVFEQALATGRYLLLVDALDEVTDLAGRNRVVNALAAHSLRGPGVARCVLTTRPTAFTGRASIGGRFVVLHPAELDAGADGSDDTQGRLIARWCQEQARTPEQERALRQDLENIADEQTERLTRNPLFLTCTMLVHALHGHLPDSPAELYQDLVGLLCDCKPAAALTVTQRRQYAERVADALQRAAGTSLAVVVASQALVGLDSVDGVERAAEALDTLANDTGLFRFADDVGADGRSRRVLRPAHRTFQEYLAATHLKGDGRGLEAVVRELLTDTANGIARAHRPEDLGMLRFYLGVQGQERAEHAVTIARLLVEAAETETDARRAGHLWALAAAAVADYHHHFGRGEVLPRLKSGLLDRFGRDGAAWALRDRLDALDALGRLGDPRLDAPLWVEIPAGEYPFGGDERGFQAAPARRVTLPRFWLAWRPVVVQDYAAFVAAEGQREPPDWHRQRRHPNAPVWGVDWHEAKAFCAWATRSWALPGHPWRLPEGAVVDLPTEAEFEAAARGPEGRLFPWGETDSINHPDTTPANCMDVVGHVYRESGRRVRVSPVGAFPRGTLPNGLADLSGNVWEWSSDAWREAGDARTWATWRGGAFGGAPGAPRVVRGGAWDRASALLRCAARNWFEPEDRLLGLGFRVACRVVSEPG